MFIITHASPVGQRMILPHECLPAPDPNASIVSLISPFTRRFLKTIKDALSAHTSRSMYPIKLTGTHVAVLVPLCNLNGNPSLLLEVREKTRAHSGEVRWADSRFSFVGFHSCWSSSSPQAERSTQPTNRYCMLRCEKQRRRWG